METARYSAAVAAMIMASSAIGEIVEVPYATIGPHVVDFEDVTGAPFPGFPYDGILSSGEVSFAERFAGQDLSFSGNLDVLSGIPDGPLALEVGEPGENLAVGTDTGTNGLYPYGPLAFPKAHGYGEGSFAVLFPVPISAFGIRTFFFTTAEETVHLQFFRSDGSLIAAIDSLPSVEGIGFARQGGVKDIAGVSIHTSDEGGLGYDGIVFDTIPSPGVLPVLGVLMLKAHRRRRAR